jgi:acetylornithine aminotransferase
VVDALEANEGFVLRHGYTYSGHPLATAAGLAALGIQQRENLLGEVPRIAHRLSTGLKAIHADGLVDEVRGEGAVWALGLSDRHDAVAVRDAVLAHGVIVRPLPANSISLCPPLVITDHQLDRIVDSLATVLAS